MSILRSLTNPTHCIRINRAGGLLPEADDRARLIVSYRYFKSAADKEAVKQGEEMIWFKDNQVDYYNEQIIFPPAGWQPKNPANYAVEYVIATGYLSMLNDPAFANEWISDEL